MMWGLAAFANYLLRVGPFRAGQAQLKWHGSRVGTIRSIDLSASANQQNLTLDQMNGTVPSLGDDDLSWDYQFHDAKLQPVHIFMSAIASLIQAAQVGDGEIKHFVGSWPDSIWRVIHFRLPRESSSTFTRNILIQSILASVNEAVRRRDYRSAKVLVKENGRDIAQGGYFDME